MAIHNQMMKKKTSKSAHTILVLGVQSLRNISLNNSIVNSLHVESLL